MKRILFALPLVLAFSPSFADPPIPVTLENHKFTPSQIHVKANQPAMILLTNKDATAEEFDSTALQGPKRSWPAITAAMCACARSRRANIRSWANIIPAPLRAVVIAQ